MQAGASDEKVSAVESAEKSALYTEPERAAIAYAEAMTITGQRVSDALRLRVMRARGACLDLADLLVRRARLHPPGCIDVDSERAAVDERDA